MGQKLIFEELWNNWKKIKVRNEQTFFSGILKNVKENGNLILEDNSGKIIVITSGDVELIKVIMLLAIVVEIQIFYLLFSMVAKLFINIDVKQVK